MGWQYVWRAVRIAGAVVAMLGAGAVVAGPAAAAHLGTVATSVPRAAGSMAEAATARAAALSQTICINTPPPVGWMITSYGDSSMCGVPGNGVYNAKVIADVRGTPAGGSVTACQMPSPSGFYATSWSYAFRCEASKTPNRLFNNLQQVTNLNGMPAGYTAVICGIQAAPAGWVLLAVVAAYQCVYVNGGGVGQNAVSIRKS